MNELNSRNIETIGSKVNTMNRTLLKKHKWAYIFAASFTLCMLALCLFVIWAIVEYGSLKNGIIWLVQSAFSDFGQVIYFICVDNPYTASFPTMYTPINFLFYLPFALICGSNEAFYTLGTVSVDEYNYAILQTWEFWVSFICYYIIVFTALFFVLKKTIPTESLSEKISFFFAMGFSTIIGFGFIRGSNVFICLVLFIAYFNWYKSDKRWKRELALVFFAVAGTMKFYVLFGGVLLLKEKRWADVLKCVLYVGLCFFIPFLFYESPLETIGTYINNLLFFVDGEGRIGITTNISVYNLVYCFFSLFGVENSVGVTILCWIAAISVFALGIVICLKSKNCFTDLIVICSVFALVSPVSYLYVLSFMILPYALFEREKQSFSKKRKTFYSVAFFILLFIPLILFKFFLIYTIELLVILIVETVFVFKKDEKMPKLSVLEE